MALRSSLLSSIIKGSTAHRTMDFFFGPDLRGFIDDNPVIDLDTACDFVCEKFDINLTDSLLDDISEVFFEHEDVKFRLGLE